MTLDLTMQPETRFDAPWGTGLKLTTALSVAILAGLPAAGLLWGADDGPAVFMALILLPPAVLLGAVPFLIRGYRLAKGKLHIERLGWQSTIDLQEIQSFEVDPEAMKKSLRIFGNGGLFCIAGKFRNKKLGPYRAYATDPRLAVVLRFAERVVVVTPDNPARFASQLESTR